MSTPASDSLSQANRFILGLLLICFALVVTTVYLILRPAGGDSPSTSAALNDPEVRAQVIAQLVEQRAGVYDSHVDADVGRINLANLDQKRSGKILLSTNRFGIRERDYTLPKPDGVVRVVLLGDSFVFGYGVATEERLGSYLEPWLNERAGNDEVRVECLHLGVPSWNFKSAAAFLRRQLSAIAPDLVIHLSLPNDLEETSGVRGFGEWSSFSPQQRHRADSSISSGFAMRDLGFKRNGYLPYGFDYESQSRFADAVSELRRLAEALEAAGSGYRALFHHRLLLPVTWKYLGSQLEPGQAVYISHEFGNDRQYWNSPQDHHWNAAGHRKAALMIYGLIVRDGLLPQLELEPWTQAEQEYQEIAVAGLAEAERQLSLDQLMRRLGRLKIASVLEFDRLDDSTAAQIHGGIDRDQRVSPYASFVLKNEDGQVLRLSGHSLPRPELEGALVQVFVDAQQVGQIELRADQPIRESYSIPAQFRDRPFLSIRLESSDYVYEGPDLQHCVVFKLDELAIES